MALVRRGPRPGGTGPSDSRSCVLRHAHSSDSWGLLGARASVLHQSRLSGAELGLEQQGSGKDGSSGVPGSRPGSQETAPQVGVTNYVFRKCQQLVSQSPTHTCCAPTVCQALCVVLAKRGTGRGGPSPGLPVSWGRETRPR